MAAPLFAGTLTNVIEWLFGVLLQPTTTRERGHYFKDGTPVGSSHHVVCQLPDHMQTLGTNHMRGAVYATDDPYFPWVLCATAADGSEARMSISFARRHNDPW